MTYAPILRNLPEELRLTMLELVEAVEENVRAQLAVRREDFDALHTTLREVADVQYDTVERVDRLESALVRLAEAQERTEQRVEELAQAQSRTERRVEGLVEAQSRTEQRMEELAEAQSRTEQRMEELAEAQKRSEGRMERLETALAELAEAQQQTQEALKLLLKRADRMEPRADDAYGQFLELRYRDKASGYFGRLLRKARAIHINEIEDDLEPYLSEEELDDLRLADILIYGRPKLRPDVERVWLVVEVSAVIDRNDVERAQRRAAAMRKAGYLAVAAVAGAESTVGAGEAASTAKVLFVQNGSQRNWESALELALNAAV